MRFEMLPSQCAYLAALKQGRTPEMTAAAKEVDKASHTTLNMLRQKPCNAECFDCTAKKPGWAVLPHGIFVCIDCAQMHRSLGRHISQTKAINTGTYLWFPAELAVMETVGNGVAAVAFSGCNLPPKPSRDAPTHEKKAYTELKYASDRCTPSWTRTSVAVAPPPPQQSVHAEPRTSSPPPSLAPAEVVAPQMFSVSARLKKAPPSSSGLKGAKRTSTPPTSWDEPADLITFEEAEETTASTVSQDKAVILTLHTPPSNACKFKAKQFFEEFGL